MYFFSWISLVIISLWITLVAFVWAARSGQFSDQARARYLPLVHDLPAPDVKDPSRFTIEVYALMAVGGIVVVILLAPLFLSLYRMAGKG